MGVKAYLDGILGEDKADNQASKTACANSS